MSMLKRLVRERLVAWFRTPTCANSSCEPWVLESWESRSRLDLIITDRKAKNTFSFYLYLEKGGVGGQVDCKADRRFTKERDVPHDKGSTHASREATESFRTGDTVE